MPIPTKEGYERFKKGYTGMMEVDRAYMQAATGDPRYGYRRDIFPGTSVNNLPRKRDLPKSQQEDLEEDDD